MNVQLEISVLLRAGLVWSVPDPFTEALAETQKIGNHFYDCSEESAR